MIHVKTPLKCVNLHGKQRLVLTRYFLEKIIKQRLIIMELWLEARINN